MIKAQDGRDPLTQEVLDNIIKPVRLLDIYEMNESRVELINPVDKKSEDIINDRWEVLSNKVSLKGLLTLTIDKVIFRARLNGVHEVYDDGRKANLPNNCMLLQLASMGQLGDLFQVDYDNRLYNMLPELDKAALRFHEWIYTYARHSDSRQTRAIVGKIFEADLINEQPKTLRDYLRSLFARPDFNTASNLYYLTNFNILGTDTPVWKNGSHLSSVHDIQINHSDLGEFTIQSAEKRNKNGEQQTEAFSSSILSIGSFTISPNDEHFKIIIKDHKPNRIYINDAIVTSNFTKNNYRYTGNLEVRDGQLIFLRASRNIKLFNSNITCSSVEFYDDRQIKSCFESQLRRREYFIERYFEDIKLVFKDGQERAWGPVGREHNGKLVFHENGQIKSYINQDEIEFENFKCQKNSRVGFDKNGKLTYCYIPEGRLSWEGFSAHVKYIDDHYRGATILPSGYPARLEVSEYTYNGLRCQGKNDYYLHIYETGVPQGICKFPNENVSEVDGIGIKQYISYYPSGDIKSTMSAKRQKINGKRLKKNDHFELNETGDVVKIIRNSKIIFDITEKK